MLVCLLPISSRCHHEQTIAWMIHFKLLQLCWLQLSKAIKCSLARDMCRYVQAHSLLFLASVMHVLAGDYTDLMGNRQNIRICKMTYSLIYLPVSLFIKQCSGISVGGSKQCLVIFEDERTVLNRYHSVWIESTENTVWDTYLKYIN